MRLLKLISLTGIISLGLACNKKNDLTETPQEAAQRADLYVGTAFLSVETAINELEFIARHVPQIQTDGNFLSCAIINRQQVPEGEKVEITFSNNACDDQTIRSGKLILTYEEATGNIFISPVNYRIRETKISGNYVFQPGTFEQKPILKLVVPDGAFTADNGDYYRFSIERISYFKEGKDTPTIINDDIFETLEASYDFELKSQGAVTLMQAESHTPYIIKYSCPDKFRPRSGKVKFERVTSTYRYILFGNGNCNDLARISETP
ncbi:hypothetical protein [Desertivirga xinjiangensis]|uniref:hypothetical protein n=1 Tax=Desertivirga xinjiangensis TaxID=539206 RepID=UPI00210A805D|nr:hypothetical protein [Pedobacter xinjiangensis]